MLLYLTKLFTRSSHSTHRHTHTMHVSGSQYIYFPLFRTRTLYTARCMPDSKAPLVLDGNIYLRFQTHKSNKGTHPSDDMRIRNVGEVYTTNQKQQAECKQSLPGTCRHEYLPNVASSQSQNFALVKNGFRQNANSVQSSTLHDRLSIHSMKGKSIQMSCSRLGTKESEQMKPKWATEKIVFPCCAG